MRKARTLILALVLACSLAAAAWAADTTVTFAVSCDGENVVYVQPGDTITVTVSMSATDSQEVGCIQNEITYGSSASGIFETVEEGSIQLAEDFKNYTGTIPPDDLWGNSYVYIYYTGDKTSTVDETPTVVATFTLKVSKDAKAGQSVDVSSVRNSYAKDGDFSDCKLLAQPLRVVVGDPDATDVETPEPTPLEVGEVPSGGVDVIAEVPSTEEPAVTAAEDNSAGPATVFIAGSTSSGEDVDASVGVSSVGVSSVGVSSIDALEQVQSCLGDETCLLSPYEDVSAAEWYHDGIHYCVQRGLMTGVDQGTFAPNGTLTRAMVATILYRMAGSPAVTADSGFADVADGQWYADAVAWAAQSGIVTGYSDAVFQPAGEITREQLALMLYRYAQYKNYDTAASGDLSVFTDAGSIGDWAKDAVAWANGAGLINGRSETLIAPQGTATRAEAASIIYRFERSLSE